MTNFPLQPPHPIPLRGDEPFEGVNATVMDFWRFALSDLKMNNVRGYVAEFLVAQAVGATGPRIEWDAYDVLAPDGTTIEVKTSAHLQAWEQRAVSQISFSGLKGRIWKPATGYAAEQTYNADVYVFAVQTATTHEEYDALSTSQWEFYVAPRVAVVRHDRTSIGLSALERLAGPAIAFPALADAITTASARPSADSR